MTPSTRKKGIVTSLGVLTAVATLLSGGVTTAYANDALANTALMQLNRIDIVCPINNRILS